MKQVLSVQDISCLGKCSLTVALPVLSAMGCACTALPTAILSTHTGFPDPFVRSLTEDIAPICTHFKSIGASFDAILVGYLSGEAQVAEVGAVLDAFPTFTVIDPAMGDHGKLYSGITPAQVRAVKGLCKNADVLIPNITEGCLLTDTPYEEHPDEETCSEIIKKLQTLGAKQVVLTGVCLEEGKVGFMTSEGTVYQSPRQEKKCHGTGDLFAAVFTGAMLRGKDLLLSATLAAGFVEQVIDATAKASAFGVEFETQLPWLWKQLKEK